MPYSTSKYSGTIYDRCRKNDSKCTLPYLREKYGKGILKRIIKHDPRQFHLVPVINHYQNRSSCHLTFGYRDYDRP